MRGLRLGLHLSIGRGFAATLAEARRLKLESLQIFSGNPRAWRAKDIDPDQAVALAQGLAAAGISPLVIHAPYLLNLASPDEELYQRSLATLTREMERGRMLGAACLVFHPGSHKGAGPKKGLGRVVRAIGQGLELGAGSIVLAVENTAGGGDHLGGRLEELAAIIDQVQAGGRVAVWLDTAHAFGAGYDLSTPKGVDEWVRAADELIGLERVVGLHINDSLAALGSHIDRHQHLGAGLIGARALSRVLAHPDLAGKPGIMETPKRAEGDDRRNLKTARRLRTLGLKKLNHFNGPEGASASAGGREAENALSA
ncbi:MAG: deoxyribonuclease IV [Deltaproteobacteria bacterium]|nr:deoxyribonuclease IV [Deltaproteobacteria bacterium]